MNEVTDSGDADALVGGPATGDTAVAEAEVPAAAGVIGAPDASVDLITGTQVEVEPEPVAAQVIFGARLDLARRYVAWLEDAGVVRGLIGPREPARIWTRHVLNCGVVAALLPDAARVVDVGSGAGLPGIPWAIARPDCFITLVEPLERRVNFLDEVVADLGLSNVRVIRGRAEDVVDQCGQADVVTSRAVAPLAKLARWSAPLVRHGGELLALKGARAAEEIVEAGRQLERIGVMDLRAEEVGQGIVEETTFVIRGRIDRAAAAGKRSSKGGYRAKRSK